MPKFVDHEARKEAIIAKTYELLQTKNAKEITMREIAKELKMTPGSIYCSFKDKSAIKEQVLLRMVQEDMTLLRKSITPEMVSSDRLRAISDYVISRTDFLTQVMMLLAEYISASQASSQFVKEGYIALDAGIKDLLAHEDAYVADILLARCIGLVSRQIVCRTPQREENFRRFLGLELPAIIQGSGQ